MVVWCTWLMSNNGSHKSKAKDSSQSTVLLGLLQYICRGGVSTAGRVAKNTIIQNVLVISHNVLFEKRKGVSIVNNYQAQFSTVIVHT